MALLAKGPGPGPLGPGAGAGTPWARGLGAPGPKMWDTRGERNYLQSGKLPTVRQATYCQAKLPTVRQATYCQAKLPTVRQSYLQSGKATYSQAELPTVKQSYLLSGKATYSQAKLPTVRHAPNRSIDMHPKAAYMQPKGIDMHPKVSIYFAPNYRILCTQPSHRHAPKRHRLCTQR